MKNILFTASECTPFIKTGGLADVIGSLPQALVKENLANVRVILPKYGEIPEQWHEQMEEIASFPVRIGWRNQGAKLFKLEHDAITFYFIENHHYFERHGIYGYYDDGERFVFYSKAVIESLPYLDFVPDILHAHDWQAGLTVAFANILQPVKNMKTIFTIHNIKYQGMLQYEAFDDLFNIPREHFAGFEWNGMLNAMKSGIFHADKITTVSPTYAEEIKQPFYGEGLEPLLRDRQGDLSGIINGINTEDYNPMKDPYIHANYQHSRVKKKENKKKLQEMIGLPVKPDVPMYIAISRFVEQKGFHLVEHILHDFLQQDVQVVILGTGEYEFESSFSWFAQNFPEKMATLLKFDEGLARQLYAAADFFLMPSKFEPCGLSQLISLQYKTVPIVRETGGLKDTVFPFNEFTGEGNGFSFQNYNAHELLEQMEYSLKVYHNEKQWQTLLKNVNKSKFSWTDSAVQYAELYRDLAASQTEGE